MLRVTIQFHDATAERPTDIDLYWDVVVMNDNGDTVVTTQSLKLWAAASGTSGFLTSYTQAARERWLNAVGDGFDFTRLDHRDRLIAGLKDLFGGVEVEVLPFVPAPS